MKGDADVITSLNEILTAELTAINQYYIHYKMCENWGYAKLAANKRGESMDEMKHADQIIDRILYLDGIPNMQRLNPVRVGQDPIEQHRLDLAVEADAIERLNKAIEQARAAGDHGTRKLLEEILEGEEEGLDWLEAQLGIVEKIGEKAYLAEQIHDA